jgi:hypothetical protein
VIADAHLGVQAPLLGHVAERQAICVREQPAAPADRALVRRLDAHHDPHGRGLPSPVGAEEPEDPPALDGERQAAQGDRPPGPPAQPGQLEWAGPMPAVVAPPVRSAASETDKAHPARRVAHGTESGRDMSAASAAILRARPL